jgi:hypothetical protein
MNKIQLPKSYCKMQEFSWAKVENKAYLHQKSVMVYNYYVTFNKTSLCMLENKGAKSKLDLLQLKNT